MKRIVIEIDQVKTAKAYDVVYPMSRFVLRSEKIVGLAEYIDGTVRLSIQTSEDAPVVSVVPKNSFDEIAKFMTE